MQLNIINIVYLLFRFAPFIIISYFTIQSIFQQDFKGFIYLLGLLVVSCIVVCISVFFATPNYDDEQTKEKCTQLTIGANDSPISNLPLSQTVYGYTLAYLSYFITINNLTTQNITTFIVLPLLIVADIFWNQMNRCFSSGISFTALLVGGIFGAIWALLIDSMNMPSLVYYSGSSASVCSKPSKNLYRCRTINTSN